MVDVERITKLRIIIARSGEMDRYKWWNTKGMLANIGEMAISRGLPKSHIFARSQAVFAVAAARSDEVFNPPETYTLWRLPVEIEDQVEEAWARWLGTPEPWLEFLATVDEISADGVLPTLTKLRLASQHALARTKKLKRADDSRSVPVKVDGESAEQLIDVLAAAHSCSEVGKLAVPFIRESEFPK